jgi:hypothetical protein
MDTKTITSLSEDAMAQLEEAGVGTRIEVETKVGTRMQGLKVDHDVWLVSQALGEYVNQERLVAVLKRFGGTQAAESEPVVSGGRKVRGAPASAATRRLRRRYEAQTPEVDG